MKVKVTPKHTVEFSVQVHQQIDEWKRKLRAKKRAKSKYRREVPGRAKQKTQSMSRFLKSLGDFPYKYPICKWGVLGQKFEEDGTPIFENLRETSYKDESGFIWKFS